MLEARTIRKDMVILMKKTNLIKAVVCGAMLTLVMGSTVMAGSVTRSLKVRNTTTYNDDYEGTYGHYYSSSTGSNARMVVVNVAGSSKLFSASVKRYNYNDLKYDDRDDHLGTINNGDVVILEIVRDKSKYVYDYIHHAESYMANTTSSGTRMDYYDFTAKQYYY